MTPDGEDATAEVDEREAASETDDERKPPRWRPPGSRLLTPLFWAVDQFASLVMDQPAHIRWRASPLDALRGRAEVMTLGVRHVEVSGLGIDRVVARVSDVRLEPGVPPRVTGGPVRIKATVTQADVDRWVGHVGLPMRLELTADGVMSSTGLGPIRLARVLTELDSTDGELNLRPRRAVAWDLPEPVQELISGSLPLPELPEGAVLAGVAHRDGAISVYFELDGFDESLDAGVARRLRRRLNQSW